MSPIRKLRIAVEYVKSGKSADAAKRISEKYGIKVSTLKNLVKEFNQNYLELFDFYKYIMGDLAANGFIKAAQFLRDYAVDIFSDCTGTNPPKVFESDLSFDDVGLPPAEETETGKEPQISGDDITDSLKVIGQFGGGF